MLILLEFSAARLGQIIVEFVLQAILRAPNRFKGAGEQEQFSFTNDWEHMASSS